MATTKSCGITWITSYPKSGNTWFRLVVASLLHDPGGDHPLINQLGAVPSASSRTLFDEVAGVSSSDLTQAEVMRLRASVFREWARLAGRPTFLKLHDAFLLDDHGAPSLPVDATAAVVYLVRNPLDVAVSYAHHSAVDVDTAIDWMALEAHAIGGHGHPQMLQVLGSWSTHVRGWLEQEHVPVHLVRYEDLVREPLATFAAALRLVGLPHDDASVDAALQATNFDRLQAREREVGFWEKNPRADSFFRRGEAGAWREVLTDAQQSRIVADHGTMMTTLGYLDERGQPVT